MPVNLCVPVPEGVDPRHAAFTTVGAIAMQGLRQADMALGEVACVIGLGLIGQLLVQLLRANGVAWWASTSLPSGAPWPRSKGGLRRRPRGCGPGAGRRRPCRADGRLRRRRVPERRWRHQRPRGAGGPLARDRGRVVDIGKCSLDFPWNACTTRRNLDVRFSRSHGPGRYDPMYEEQGVDYLVGYVRWTEGRNLACFVDLLARDQIQLDLLISAVTPFDTAVQTYEQLDKGEPPRHRLPVRVPGGRGTDPHGRPAPPADPGREGVTADVEFSTPATKPVRIGFIAGNYAPTMLLPHLKEREDVALAHVATASSLSCMTAQRRSGSRPWTDYRALLADESIDAVVIATRHQSHASMTCEALRAGKAVRGEALAITQEQLEAVVATVAETGNARLRLQPPVRATAHHAQAALRRRAVPGWPGTSSTPAPWTRRAGTPTPAPRAHASRRGWSPSTRRLVVRRAARLRAGRELRRRGRCAGHHRVRRRLDRYRQLRDDGQQAVPQGDRGPAWRGQGRSARQLPLRRPLWAGRRKRRWRAGLSVDKGQKAEPEAFVRAVRTGGPMLIPLETLIVTDATLAVGGERDPGRHGQARLAPVVKAGCTPAG